MTRSSVMTRLRTETRNLHEAAEQHPFQQRLMKAELPKDAYVHYLAEMLFVHQTLEGHLRQNQTDPVFRRVLRDYQFQRPYLIEDMSFFGVNGESHDPSPATAGLVSRIERTALHNPGALLGYHYVLEGSNNGSRFVALAVRKAYALADGEGTRYLDPYGSTQPKRWKEFKQDMESLELSEAEIDALVATAQEMFEGLIGVFDELLQTAADSANGSQRARKPQAGHWVAVKMGQMAKPSKRPSEVHNRWTSRI